MARRGSWPTPRSEDSESCGAHGNRIDTLTSAVRRWPTPTAGDADASGSRNTEGSKAHAGTSLTDAVRGDGGVGRTKAADLRLNPAWTAWLMGYPAGWDDTKPMEKEVFDAWLGRAKTSSTAIHREHVLDVREPESSSTTPQGPQPIEQYPGKYCNTMPTLPQVGAHESWGLGPRGGEVAVLHDMRDSVSANEEPGQGLLASVREEGWAPICAEEMGESFHRTHLRQVQANVPGSIESEDMQSLVRERVGVGTASSWWHTDPGETGEIPRALPVADTNTAIRRARLKAIGNGQVPQCAAEAFSQLVTRAYA